MEAKTKTEICEEAAEYARSVILKDCKAANLRPRRVLKKISEGLDALENKIFYDKDRGKCIVGPDQINWTARQKSIDQAISVLGIKAPEKSEVKVTTDIAAILEAARARVKKAKESQK